MPVLLHRVQAGPFAFGSLQIHGEDIWFNFVDGEFRIGMSEHRPRLPKKVQISCAEPNFNSLLVKEEDDGKVIWHMTNGFSAALLERRKDTKDTRFDVLIDFPNYGHVHAVIHVGPAAIAIAGGNISGGMSGVALDFLNVDCLDKADHDNCELQMVCTTIRSEPVESVLVQSCVTGEWEKVEHRHRKAPFGDHVQTTIGLYQMLYKHHLEAKAKGSVERKAKLKFTYASGRDAYLNVIFN